MLRLFIPLFLVLILRSFATQRKSSKSISANGTERNHCRKISRDFFSCRDGRDGRDGRNGKDGRDGRDGITINGRGIKGEKGDQGVRGSDGVNGVKGAKGEKGFRGIDGKDGTKGQKGERGFPGKSARGVIKFSDTALNCTQKIAGTVRYSITQKILQLCDGSDWLPLLTVGKGYAAEKPGRHCLDILNSRQSRGSGLYWIDPNGGLTDDSFQAFCDMDTERGGWTLVATKVSASFPFIKSVFSPVAAKTKTTDASSHIHSMMKDWTEVMFRFSHTNTIRVIYNRNVGAPNKGKEEFDKFLMGKSMQAIKKVYGFYKYNTKDYKRSPARGFATISSVYFYSNNGISESHSGTDKWLDIWNGDDNSNNYIYIDDSRARGTKCIAGYCFLRKPIWVMVR